MRILPAEWAPQSAVMLTWPHDDGPMAPMLEATERVYIDLATAITRYQKLIVACMDKAHLQHIRRALAIAGVHAEKVIFAIAPSNDIWARDHAPISVLQDGRPLLLNFRFNGWGRKYPYDLDNMISRKLHEQNVFSDTPMTSLAFVLEGGSIESDGHGSLLTTRNCLLSPERNPAFDCIGMEGYFAEIFGVERVLWLDHGELEGDDTDGHIDTLARFCDAHTIAHASCTRPADPHYRPLLEMEGQLRSFVDYTGQPYRLVPLPLPSPKYDDEGHRLPATYANFLIINGAVLVPVYDDVMDSVALERLAGCFPEREIIPVNCLPLIRQYGSLHCVTMQFPEGVS